MVLEIGSRISLFSRKWAIGFDSRAAGCFNSVGAGGGQQKVVRSWAAWLEGLSQGAVEIPSVLNFGITGNNTNDVVTRLDACVASAVAASAAGIIILVSTNDRDSLSYATTKANLALIIPAFINAGLKVALIAELPRGPGSSNALAGQQLAYHMRTVEDLREWALVPGVWVIDPWPLMSDMSSTAGSVKTGLFYDDKHMNALGNFVLAQCIMAQAGHLFPPQPGILPSGAADIWSADNPRGSITDNPRMTGTGVTPAQGTGTMATAWNSQSAIPSGLTCAYTGDTACADGRLAQKLVLGGTPAAAGSFNVLQQNANYGTKGIAAAGLYEVFYEMEIDGDTAGLQSVAPFLIADPSGTPTQRYIFQGEGSVSGFPNGKVIPRMSGKSDPMLLPAGTVLRTGLVVNYAAGAVAGTIRVLGLGARAIG